MALHKLASDPTSHLESLRDLPLHLSLLEPFMTVHGSGIVLSHWMHGPIGLRGVLPIREVGRQHEEVVDGEADRKGRRKMRRSLRTSRHEWRTGGTPRRCPSAKAGNPSGGG